MPDVTRWLDAQEQQTWRALLAAGARVQDSLERQLHGAGMPHAYYMILVTLSESPGRTRRMSELATALHSSQSRLSHAVARLEEAGWVRRERCPTDRRGNLAVLTDAGFAQLHQTAPGHVEEVRRVLFDRLSPQQVTQLHQICAALLR